MSDLPCIAVTSGEPAGIGPDLCLQLAAADLPCRLTIIADPALLRQRAKALGLDVTVLSSESIPPATAGTLHCTPVSLNKAVTAGVLDAANAAYVVEMLRLAGEGCLQGDFQAMVTAPVHKGIINQAGTSFSGHTEFLEQLTDSPQSVMMLACAGLRVALVTTHLPLSQVSAAITSERLTRVISVLERDLRLRFGIQTPAILVCGLNPHAGEDGHLGREELDLIIPVLESLREQGLNLTGPVPADTAFTPENLNGHDVVLTMFHDQGLPVLKQQGFGEAVNITLGLPIIRTSVDHGTALSLAASGKANADSLQVALSTALAMCTKHAATTPM